MAAVSRNEWERHASGEADAEEAAAAVAEHAEPGHEAVPAPPRAGVRRPWSASVAGRPARGARPARHAAMREAGSQREHSPGHAQGVPEFPPPLPGAHHYPAKDEVLPHRPLDVGPAEPYYSAGMAHGVPAPVHHGGRPTARPEDRAAIEASRQAVAEQLREPPEAIPVYMVKRAGGTHPLLRAVLRQAFVPAPGADPVVLVPRDTHRKSVRLLNESAVPVRITYDLTESGGALLPASMTGYLEIDTQDEICAYIPATGGPVPVAVPGTFTGAAGGTASLPAGASITGLIVTAPSTAAVENVTVTVSGLQGSNLVFDFVEPNAGNSYGYLNVPLPSLPPAAGGAITVTVSVNASGSSGHFTILGSTSAAAISDPALVSLISQYEVAAGA